MMAAEISTPHGEGKLAPAGASITANSSSARASAVPSRLQDDSHQSSGDYSTPSALGSLLNRDCDLAVTMLKKMTDTSLPNTPSSKTQILPLDYIKRCKGLQFLVIRTGGLVVSVTHGRGFTIQKLTGEDGSVTWSGPLFSTIDQIGLGLSVGYNEIDTVVILGTQAAVDEAKRGEARWGLDLDLVAGRDSTVVQSNAQWTEAEAASIPFSLADGALLDISFKGGAMTINKKKNEAIYGPGVSAEEILEGSTSPPPEFQPLFDLLNHMIGMETTF